MKDTGPDLGVEALLPRVRRHVGDLFRLAWPVMISRAGMLIMAFTTIALLGRYELGAAGEANLGISIFVPLLVISIGLISGMIPVVSQAFGAGAWEECGRAWRRAMHWGVLISCVCALICWQGEPLLRLFGQTEEMATRGGAVARMLALGLIGQSVFAVCAFYLESTRRTKPSMVVMIGANFANLLLNWLLIWGHWGLPELGAVGAALGTTIVRVGMGAAMVGYILAQRDPGTRGGWGGLWGPGGWAAGRQMRRMGVAAGLSNGFETVGFAAMTMYAGTLGPLALDAYSMSHNLLSTLFMVGLGLAVATGVRVGNALGAGRRDEATLAGWVGLGTALVVMASLGLLVYLTRPGLAAVYTDDPVVIARAAALFALSALVFTPDSAQVVLGQALRAFGDAWVPVAIYIGAFILFLLPCAWVAVYVIGADERGLVVSIIAACWIATLMMAWRFHVITRGPRR